ncbi:hypothetical protein VH569_33805, partial [Azospirillum sp. 11R-A]
MRAVHLRRPNIGILYSSRKLPVRKRDATPFSHLESHSPGGARFRHWDFSTPGPPPPNLADPRLLSSREITANTRRSHPMHATHDARASGTGMLNKVPEVTLIFWIIKIMSTTVGETGADYLAVHVGLGTGLT